MKKAELLRHTVCDQCGKRIGKTASPFLFWVIKAERFCIDLHAVRRSDSFSSFLGSEVLADAIGTDDDLAKVVHTKDLTLCEDCALSAIGRIVFDA